MKYDFDQVIDRSQNRAAKYDERKLKFGTDDVIPLWVADMDFCTAQPIIDACCKKAQEGIWGYTARPDSYFEAVKGWEKRRNGWEVDTALMSWSLGVVPTLSALVKIFTKEGAKVMIQTPVYSEFYDVVEAWGRQVVENRLVEKDGVWTIDMETFARQAKEVEMFLLCNPHNPLGIVWKPEELQKMAKICIEEDVLLVSDEIHSDLIFNGKKHTPTAALSKEIGEKVITCISATKTFNLAGLQASTTIFPDQEKKEALTASGGTWISAGTMPSAPWPWKRRTMKGKNGWSSSWPILPGISGSSGTIVSSTSRRSSRTSRTPPIWCGWTAGSWGWTMQSLGGS